MIFYAGTGSLLLRDSDSVTLFDVQQKRYVFVCMAISGLFEWYLVNHPWVLWWIVRRSTDPT